MSIAEGFDSSTPTGRLLRSQLGAFAEFEWEVIRERMMAGQRSMAVANHWPAGPPPPGYRIVPDGAHKRLEIEEEEGEAYRRAIAVLVDEGGTVGDAAKRLNALGYRRRRGGRWNRTALRKRLVLDHWSGTWVWRKNTDSPVVLSIPPLITPERHAQLRHALASAINTGPRTTQRQNFYPLSLRIHGECGAPFSGIARYDRAGTRFYRCRNRNVHAVERGLGCDDRWMHADDVERLVWSTVRDLLARPERLLAMASDFLGQRAERVDVEMNQIVEVERKIAKLEVTLGKQVAEYLAEGIDARAVKLATASLEADLDGLRALRDRLLAWQESNRAESERLRRLHDLAEVAHLRLHSMTPREQAQVYDLLQMRVSVLGWVMCAACQGSKREKGTTTRASCAPCHGTGSQPSLRIEGVVHDQLLLRRMTTGQSADVSGTNSPAREEGVPFRLDVAVA